MFLVMRICWVLGVWVGGFSQVFGRRWRIVADFDRTADGPNGEVGRLTIAASAEKMATLNPSLTLVLGISSLNNDKIN
jgi:hypothetical protein